MKRILLALAAALFAASTGVIGYWSGHRAPGEADKEETKEAPEAKVRVAPARWVTMGKSIVAYGVVRPAPEGVHVFSVPFESRVRRFLVTPGQTVAAGAVLLEVDPSPATLLQEKQAQSALEAAGRKLAQAKHAAALQKEEARTTLASATKRLAQAKHAATLEKEQAHAAQQSAAKILAQTQHRVEMKLGTAQELLQAQQEADMAKLKLESLEKLDATQEVLIAQQDLTLAELRLASIEKLPATAEELQAQGDLRLAELQLDSLAKLGLHTPQVKAEMGGVVNNTIAQEGQIVAAGGPLIELAEEKQIEVKLGVEPDEAAELRESQPVRIIPVGETEMKPVEGTLHRITRRVNPSSRLVEVFVSLPPDAKLLLESYVRGVFTVDTKKALAVPRSAVLPSEDKQVLFTLKDGKAVRHVVTTGLEDDEQVEVLGDAIQPGELVVVEGNYELEDGMGAEVEKEPAAEK